MSYKVVDFFCGAGGFSEGFHQAGFEIVRAFDIWEPAINTHNKNHPSTNTIAVYGDVFKISKLPDDEFEKLVPDTEIIIGSPPCVAFSNSNKSGKADKTLGILLLESYLRIIARKKFKKGAKLKYWLLENVTNIQEYIKVSYSMQDLGLPGSEILYVKNESSKEYNVKYFGAPSNRKRYICGEFPEPLITHTDSNIINLRQVVQCLGKPYENIESSIYDLNYDFSLKGKDISDHHYIKEIPSFEWRKAERQKRDKGYMGKMSFPEDFSKPARTIMATMSASSRESLIFPYKQNRYRYPTIREVATAMSFPIDYRFYGESDAIKYKLVGNAVPPKFSYALAKAIVIKEGLSDVIFTQKTFDEEDIFLNLNNKKFELKEEKLKKKTARYKYHVPYLIIDAYRTELLNNFDDGQVKWKCEIHKGQGKSAKLYSNISDIKEALSFLNKEELIFLSKFISKKIKKIISNEVFQNNYRQIGEVKKKKKLMGPDQLLEEVKIILVEKFADYEDSILVKSLEVMIPQKILISYFIINSVLEGVEL